MKKIVLFLLFILLFNISYSQEPNELITNSIHFKRGSSKLIKESKNFLRDIIKILKENSNLILEFTSHSDCKGSISYNLKLSKQRSNSIKKYLLNNGVKIEKIQF